MKSRLTLLLIFSISVAAVDAQTFEGKVTYQNTYVSKTPGVGNEQFQLMLGTENNYIIKGGDYKSETNGQMLLWSLYINKDNKLYSKIASQPAIFWNDGAENKDEVKKATINKEVLEILGYKCDELILETTNGTQKFYYSPNIKLDATLFEKHKFGNWSTYASKTNAIPLKMIVETPQLTITSTATAVTPTKIDATTFELPAGASLVKSPF